MKSGAGRTVDFFAVRPEIPPRRFHLEDFPSEISPRRFPLGDFPSEISPRRFIFIRRMVFLGARCVMSDLEHLIWIPDIEYLV